MSQNSEDWNEYDRKLPRKDKTAKFKKIEYEEDEGEPCPHCKVFISYKFLSRSKTCFKCYRVLGEEVDG